MRMVPEVGLEPTLAEANTALNRARLPIPPLRQRTKQPYYRRRPGRSKRARPALARGRPALATGQGTLPRRHVQHSPPQALGLHPPDGMLLAPSGGGARRAPWRTRHAVPNARRRRRLHRRPGLPSQRAAADEDGYRHGRVRFVEPGVTLQRATEVSAEEALANLPFLPGDRVWTDAAGRAEFQFPDGTRRAARQPQQARLLRPRGGPRGARRAAALVGQPDRCACARSRRRRFEVETPAGTVRALDRGDAARRRRVGRDARERLRAARRCSTTAASACASRRASARSRAGAPRPRSRGASSIAPENDDSPSGTRRASPRSAGPSRSSEYLPDELDPTRASSSATAAGATRRRSATSGSPRVAVGWQPLLERPLGVDALRLDLGALRAAGAGPPPTTGAGASRRRFGWYWAPGRTWGPGWVSWAVGGGYVGWCPLGCRDQPVYGPGAGTNRGYAVSRGRCGHGPLERRARGRLRAPRRGAAPHAARPDRRRARSGRGLAALRPTRDARSSLGRVEPDGARDQPAPDARRLRARAGASTTRRRSRRPGLTAYGPPPAGVDGARYGAQRRTDGEDDQALRGLGRLRPAAAGARRPRARDRRRGRRPRAGAVVRAAAAPESPAGERGTAATAGALGRSREPPVALGLEHAAPPGSERPRRAGRAHRAERAAPPAALAGGAGTRAPAASSAAQRDESSAYRRAGATREHRPARDSSRSEPRAQRETPDSSRAKAARASAAERGGGSHARPSGGGSSGSRSGGHAAARPRGNRESSRRPGPARDCPRGPRVGGPAGGRS